MSSAILQSLEVAEEAMSAAARQERSAARAQHWPRLRELLTDTANAGTPEWAREVYKLGVLMSLSKTVIGGIAKALDEQGSLRVEVAEINAREEECPTATLTAEINRLDAERLAFVEANCRAMIAMVDARDSAFADDDRLKVAKGRIAELDRNLGRLDIFDELFGNSLPRTHAG